MKKINIVLIFAISICTAGLFSCKKAVEGYNTDPNNPLDADAITMLTGIEVGNMTVQEGELARIAGMWSGYFVGQQQQYQAFHQYLIIARNFDDAWRMIFSGVLKNDRLMKAKALELNNLRLVGVAQVIEANLMGTAADLWGDVPFSQAYSDNYPNPAYDPQATVYADVQDLLDSAISNLGSNAFVDFSQRDVQFAGNMTKWIQTAYTLKARYYLHTREYEKALDAAGHGISNMANNWLAPHNSSARGTYNLYYQFFALDRPAWMDADGAFAPALLNAAAAQYRGNAKTVEKARFKYMYSSATNPNYTSKGFFYQTVSFPLASYRENMLILAEADARVNGFAAGLSRLNNYRSWMAGGGYLGSDYLIPGDYKYDAYVAADFDAGGMENAGASALTPARALLREILEERYVSFIGQIEGFNDLRRNFKDQDICVPVPPNAGSQFPQRFLYSQEEVDLNKSIPSPIPSLFTATPVNE
ncbi:MAG TPA: SusD/RagB family nutrient-binding outer membrane lipoprotein [Chitinophagaceae bacterium]|nr:SusD/RagB family nutrient-binding outer membrane lipoprotein [Chitinophagaceae bacterium]